MDFNAIIKVVVALITVLMTFISSFISEFNGSELPPVPIVSSSTETQPISSGTTATPPSSGGASGTFTITAYGWGHGVGLSQEGAIVMAQAGSSYVEILRHYYTGTFVVSDSSTPTTIKYGGATYPIVEFLCKTVKAEIGASAPEAAIKAQAGAIYTFAKFYGFNVGSSQIAMSSSYTAGSNLEKYVLSYLGMTSATGTPTGKFVSTDGTTACLTVFGASAAGHTTDAKSVWGTYYSYLVPVSTPETVASKTYTISANDMKNYITGYKSGMTLSSNPAEWLSILNHDCSLNNSIGYVTNMRVGTEFMTGWKFKATVLKHAIRSHCFTLVYNR